MYLTRTTTEALFTPANGGDSFALYDWSSSDSSLLGNEQEELPQEPVPSPPLPLNENSQRLYDNWLALIPTLEDGYLCYMERAQGRLGRPLQGEPHHCISGGCVTRMSSVQCLHADCTFCSVLQLCN